MSVQPSLVMGREVVIVILLIAGPSSYREPLSLALQRVFLRHSHGG
jgi:hypothetical protein